MIDATVVHIKQRGFTSFLLEVIDTNERAKSLYLRHGFSITRSLLCYQIKKEMLEGTSSVQLQKQENISIPAGRTAMHVSAVGDLPPMILCMTLSNTGLFASIPLKVQ